MKIAYKMYLCDIIHNKSGVPLIKSFVVNCLQNVSLRYYSQYPLYNLERSKCCELLTKCIFAILFTIEASDCTRIFLL